MDILIFHICVNIFLLLTLFMNGINIEYDNKINFVFNVYTYYFKMKPRTLLEFFIYFPRSLHIVGLKWIVKLSNAKGVWHITICYMFYIITFADKTSLC